MAVDGDRSHIKPALLPRTGIALRFIGQLHPDLAILGKDVIGNLEFKILHIFGLVRHILEAPGLGAVDRGGDGALAERLAVKLTAKLGGPL